MKKRVLSALLVLCMACSMVSTVWANQATPETADKPASVLLDDSQSAPVTNAPAQDQDVAEGLTAPEDEESGQQSDVDTPDASQPEQAESTGTPVGGGVEYTAALEQDGQVLNVIVTAPEGAFDEGMEPKLSVSAIEDEAQTDGIAAKLDEYGLTYDGFAALDISFKNEAGEEIEPKVPVTVRIELPQAIVDSGIDLNTLAVQHLEEDENGDVKNVTEVATLDNGITLSEEAAAAANEAAGVAPMSDMPAEEATAGDASETPAAVAEFDVDGFSSFVITWVNYDDGRNTASLKVVIRNADTHQEMNIPGLDVSEWNEYLGDNTTITVEQLVNSLNTGNYEFQYATYYTAQNRNEQEFWSVRALRSDVQGDWSNKPRYHFYFNGSNDYVRVTESDATVYLYYKENEPGGSGGDQGGTGTTSTTVTTGKSAVKIDGTNNYTLNLSVSGDRGSQTQKQAVDVLFIIDRSASMEKSLGSWQTKIGAVKSAVSTLVNSINDPQDSIEVRYSAIRFSNASGTLTVGNGWYSENNASNFINQINAITTNEGTNWEAGIHKAIETLDGSDRPNATKIVVFLSDGVPTYSGGFNGESEHGDGSDHASSYYGQSEKTISGFADDAAKEIEKLDCDYFFAIGIGSDFNLGNRGRTYMTRLTDHVQAGIPTRVLSANNETDLESAFNMIEEATRFFAANNVVMVDQMSDYADLVPVNGGSNNGQYEFTLALEKKASAEEDYLPVQGASQTVYVTANSNQGTTVTLQDGTEQVPITVFVDKDDSTGKETIRVVFGKTSDGKLYELAQNYRYTVSTVITPSQKAITEGKDQYNGEGEANTGTHAGADGFWSNDNDNALVNYNAITTDENGNITDSTPGTPVYFPKPVIQVQEPDNGSLTIDKNVNGVNAEGVTFTFTVIAGEDVTSTLPEEFGENGTATVTVTAGGHAVLNDLPFGTYTVTETGAPDVDATSTDGSYHCSGTTYQVGDGTSSNNPVDVILNTDTENQTVTVTNTYTANFTPDPVDPDPDINKYVDDNEDGTYDLSLDITGTAVKDGDAGLNILYILDETYSMMWNMDGSCPDVDADGNESMDDNGRPYNHSGDNRYAFEDVEGEQEDTYPYTDTSIDYTTGAGGRGMYSYERYRTAVNAINTLNGVLLESGVNAEVAVVDFARTYIGENIETANSQDWTTLTDEFSLNPASYDQFASGTNYQAAFKAALDKLEDLETNHSDRLDKNTVVIFVTDGDPNRFDADNQGAAAADGEYNGTNYFDPQTVQYPENSQDLTDCVPIGIAYAQEQLEDLVTELQNLQTTNNTSSSIYAIGISDDATAQNLTNLFYKKYDVDVDRDHVDEDGELDAWNDAGVAQRFTYSLLDGTTVPDTITSGVYCSSNAEDLYQTFAEIAVEMSGASMTNVVITDELSEYAELVSTAAIPQINIQKADGTVAEVTSPTEEAQPAENGVVTYQFSFSDKTNADAESATTQTLIYTYYPAGTYSDNDHPVITLAFPSTYALTDGWTYTITVQIQPTDKAFTDYNANIQQDGNNGYGDVTGDPDTDVPDSPAEEWTSSGKPGFDSNTHADVTYTSDEKEWEKEYPVPVIQVKYVELTVNKTVTGTMGDSSSSNTFAFTLTLDSPLASPLPEDLSGTGVANSNGLYEYTFSLASGANIKINIPVGAEVTVAEADRSDYTERFRAYVTGTSAPEAFTDGYTKTIGEMNVNYTIDFQNNRDAITPTGLESNHTTPYVLMITAAGMAGLALIGGIVARRVRRRRRED